MTGSGRHGQEGENAGRIGRYGRKNGNGRTGEKEGGQGYSCSKEVRKKDGTSVQQLKKTCSTLDTWSSVHRSRCEDLDSDSICSSRQQTPTPTPLLFLGPSDKQTQ